MLEVVTGTVGDLDVRVNLVPSLLLVAALRAREDHLIAKTSSTDARDGATVAMSCDTVSLRPAFSAEAPRLTECPYFSG